jgi:predicted dehydrogenase
VRAALIGAGHIARQHLACLRELPGVKTVAVCDVSPATAEAAAERFSVPSWFSDHRRMLVEVRPDVVHITAPPHVHYPIALDALDAGAHVVVEKPATETLHQVETLLRRASEAGKVIVENQNYLFNQATREIAAKVGSGEFGAVTHVEVFICLNIVGTGSPFADPNLPHPVLRLAGGAIADFLTHLASLAHFFVGPHRTARTVWSRRSESPLPYDEFRALVDAERGTAVLGFSAGTQPEAFWLRVYGERMQAVANLFETHLTFDRIRGGVKALGPTLNMLEEGRALQRAAIGTLWRKLSGGPGTYEGLWELLARTYQAIEGGTEPPVPPPQILAVNRLVAALKPDGDRE